MKTSSKSGKLFRLIRPLDDLYPRRLA